MLATVLATATTLGACGHDGATAPTGPGSAESATVLEAEPAHRAGAPRPEPPVALRLPSGTAVRVRPATTLRSGRLDVPDDIDEAGWWRGGARIGDPFGSILVAGHVDAADQGLGAFAELLGVRAGTAVRVRSRHLEQTFRVRSLRLVPRDRVRDTVAVSSVRGPRRLTLVTCAPPYLPAEGGYQNLAVVTAVPTGDARTRSGS